MTFSLLIPDREFELEGGSSLLFGSTPIFFFFLFSSSSSLSSSSSFSSSSSLLFFFFFLLLCTSLFLLHTHLSSRPPLSTQAATAPHHHHYRQSVITSAVSDTVLPSQPLLQLTNQAQTWAPNSNFLQLSKFNREQQSQQLKQISCKIQSILPPSSLPKDSRLSLIHRRVQPASSHHHAGTNSTTLLFITATSSVTQAHAKPSRSQSRELPTLSRAGVSDLITTTPANQSFPCLLCAHRRPLLLSISHHRHCIFSLLSSSEPNQSCALFSFPAASLSNRSRCRRDLEP